MTQLLTGIPAPLLPSLEAGITFDETESSETLTVTNTDPDGPVAVALSSSPAYLTFADPSDLGTSKSLFAAAAGATVDVALLRSGSAPTSGAAVSVTVTATTAGGEQVTTTITLEPLLMAYLAIEAIGDVTHLWRMGPALDGGALVDTGSNPINAALNSIVGPDTTSPPQGLEGHLESNGTNDYIRASAVPISDVDMSGARTWIHVFTQNGDTTDSRRVFGGVQGVNWEMGYLTLRPSLRLDRNLGALLTLDGSHDHTVLGAGNSIALAETSTKLAAVAVSFDGSSTLTLRWAEKGDGPGHSVATTAQAAVSGGAGTTNWHPGPSGSSSAASALHHLSAVFNKEISEADFDSILDAMDF